MCNRCQQSFCTPHFAKHREDLSVKVESTIQEHNLLRHALSDRTRIASLGARINQWEQESILRIQTAAATARRDLEASVDRAKHDLETRMSELAQEIQRCRDSDDYAEMDIQRWSDRLVELQQMLERSSMVNIENDSNPQSVIHLIKICDLLLTPSTREELNATTNQRRTTDQLVSVISDRFSESVGGIQLCNNGLTAACLNGCFDGSYAAGRDRYSFGKHHIRYRIERKESDFFFFGILTATQTLQPRTSSAPSVCGWWELDFSVIHGESMAKNFKKTFIDDDELMLTLDCDHREIQLEHRRTQRVVTLPVDLNRCPFPWKIVLRLDTVGDRVTILL